MTIRLAIRGFAGGAAVFDERVTLEDEQMESVIPALAAQHAARMATHELHMIEIEFLDEPNRAERFFRFGTDPAGMVIPLEIRLDSDV